MQYLVYYLFYQRYHKEIGLLSRNLAYSKIYLVCAFKRSDQIYNVYKKLTKFSEAMGSHHTCVLFLAWNSLRIFIKQNIPLNLKKKHLLVYCFFLKRAFKICPHDLFDWKEANTVYKSPSINLRSDMQVWICKGVNLLCFSLG